MLRSTPLIRSSLIVLLLAGSAACADSSTPSGTGDSSVSSDAGDVSAPGDTGGTAADSELTDAALPDALGGDVSTGDTGAALGCPGEPPPCFARPFGGCCMQDQHTSATCGDAGWVCTKDGTSLMEDCPDFCPSDRPTNDVGSVWEHQRRPDELTGPGRIARVAATAQRTTAGPTERSCEPHHPGV